MRVAIALMLLIVVLPSSAWAQERFALLIGNQGYNDKVGALRNPHNDIAAVGKSLEAVGFKITALRDAGRRQVLSAVKSFAAEIAKGGPSAVGFFYYSGHGVSRPDDRANYLIPVDLKDTESADFWFDAVKLDDILGELERAAPFAAHFIVFDACRNELKLPEKTTVKGFEPVAERTGMFIAFATALGAVASDRGERNGPYAAVLAAELLRPGQDHLQLFQNVKERVYVDTARRQVPWERNGLLRRVYFGVKQLDVGQPPKAPQPCDGVEVAVGVGERKCMKPGAGKTESFKDCAECPEMVVVPAGEFMMGSPKHEEGRSEDEDPQHKVTIARPFAVGRYAVTRGEFAVFVRETNHAVGDRCMTYENFKAEVRTDRSFRNPGFDQNDRHPVVCVDWDDAKAFAAWLAKKASKLYRLLTEAEREYVTRAGATTPFWWGMSISAERANHNYEGIYTSGRRTKGQYRKRTVAADSFEANEWGLYNVHGNVWEWVEDCWHERYQGAPTDGAAWATSNCSRRVVRGGCWSCTPELLRAAQRNKSAPDYRYSGYGFRVARTLD
ncbi:MAG: SUMF1/EgtB/PvdO family nonheme iron enzyme [Hyphomicrobiaceae bacterium]